MALSDRNRQINIIDDIFASGCLLICPVCEKNLEEFEEDALRAQADALGLPPTAAEHERAGWQHMVCERCLVLWQYRTTVITKEESPDLIERRLRGFDPHDFRQCKTWCTRTGFPMPDAELVHELVHRPPSAPARLAEVPDDVTVIDPTGQNLPAMFRPRGLNGRCLAPYQARCYLAYPLLRHTDSNFEPHIRDCGDCLTLLAIEQREPGPLCPPVDLLLKAKDKGLPPTVQRLIEYHATNPDVVIPDCICQEIWPKLQPRVA